jgi:predicted ArsR family transcriptional regulator
MALHRYYGRATNPSSAYTRLGALLRERQCTVDELAEVLQVAPRTVRNYLTLLAKTQDIQVAFMYGASRYWMAPEEGS